MYLIYGFYYLLRSLYDPLGGDGLSHRGGGLLGGLRLGLDITLGGRTAAALISCPSIWPINKINRSLSIILHIAQFTRVNIYTIYF